CSNREVAIASVQVGVAVLKKGIYMTVFFEGTRSSDGKLLLFKKGSFYLATDSGILIVSVIVTGTEKLMPKGAAIIRFGKAILTFHSPIDLQKFESKEDLIDTVRSVIASVLLSELRDL